MVQRKASYDYILDIFCKNGWIFGKPRVSPKKKKTIDSDAKRTTFLIKFWSEELEMKSWPLFGQSIEKRKIDTRIW